MRILLVPVFCFMSAPALAGNMASATIGVTGYIAAPIGIVAAGSGLALPEIRLSGEAAALVVDCSGGSMSVSNLSGGVAISGGDCGGGLIVSGEPGYAFTILSVSDAEIVQPASTGLRLSAASCTGNARVDGGAIHCGVRLDVLHDAVPGAYGGSAIPVTVIYE